MKVRLLSSLFLLGAISLSSCGEIAPYDLETETEIIVGMEADYAPFNWSTSTSTQFTHRIHGRSDYADGYDVQISKSIATGIGKTLVIKALSFGGLIPALKSGSIDLAIAGMSPIEERKQQVNFSSEYYRSEVVMVVKATSRFANATSVAEFSGAKVVAQESTLYDGLIDQIPKVVHLTSLESYSDLALAVNEGVADAFISELPVAQATTGSMPGLVMVRLTNGGFDTPEDEITVSVAMRKQDTALLDAVNEVLATISTDDRNSLMEAALGRQQG